MRHLYYYVPPCPRCHSRKTGHYIKTPLSGSGYTKEQSLKMGELVRFVPREPFENAFCVNCGYEWPARIETKFWNDTQIQEERKVRGTEELYQRLLEQKEGREERRGLFSFLTGREKREYTRHDDRESFVKAPKSSVDSDAEIIDRRPRDVIEILYADEELIRKVRGEA